MTSLFRFEDPNVLRTNRVGSGYFNLRINLQIQSVSQIYDVNFLVEFSNYRFNSAGARHPDTRLEEYHSIGGYGGSQFIGFFDETTGPDIWTKFTKQDNRIPYFLGIPKYIQVNSINTEAEYNYSYEHTQTLYVASLNVARQIIKTTITDSRGENERDEIVDRKFGINPVTGEHIVIANTVLPIVFISDLNIKRTLPIKETTIYKLDLYRRDVYDIQLKEEIYIKDFIYKFILNAINPAPLSTYMHPLIRGSRVTSCDIVESNTKHFDSFFTEKRRITQAEPTEYCDRRFLNELKQITTIKSRNKLEYISYLISFLYNCILYDS